MATEAGQRTSVYLTADDVVRVEAQGKPPLIHLVREALDAREAALMNANAGRAALNTVPAAGTRGVAAMVGGRPDPEDCPHPRARRDLKNPHWCRACGARNVGR